VSQSPRWGTDRKQARAAQATLVAAVERAWRDWRAFVNEKLAILQQKKQDVTVVDDLMTPESGAGSEVVKADIAQHTRRTMEQVLESRRRAYQRDAEEEARLNGYEPPDSDEVMERLLHHIKDELNGKVHERGFALVWYEGQLVEFNHSAVTHGTSEDDYVVAKGGIASPKTKGIIAAVGGGVVFLIIVFFGLNALFSGPAPTAQGTPVASIQGTTHEFWGVQRTMLNEIVADEPPHRQGYPLYLCLSAAQQEAMQPNDTLIVTGTTSVRTYRVNASLDDRPQDVILADCRAQPASRLTGAQVEETHTSDPLDTTMVRSLITWDAAVAPDRIPQNQMRVVLTIEDPQADGVLVMVDGTRYSPSSQTPTDDGSGTTISYQVPSISAAQPAGWEQRNEGVLPHVLNLTLPPPLSRQTYLAQHTRVVVTEADIVEQDQRPYLQVALTIQNESEEAIDLMRTDIQIAEWDDGLSTRGLDLSWEPPALLPGEETIVNIVTPIDEQTTSPVQVVYGTWQARITWQ